MWTRQESNLQVDRPLPVRYVFYIHTQRETYLNLCGLRVYHFRHEPIKRGLQSLYFFAISAFKASSFSVKALMLSAINFNAFVRSASFMR